MAPASADFKTSMDYTIQKCPIESSGFLRISMQNSSGSIQFHLLQKILILPCKNSHFSCVILYQFGTALYFTSSYTYENNDIVIFRI